MTTIAQALDLADQPSHLVQTIEKRLGELQPFLHQPIGPANVLDTITRTLDTPLAELVETLWHDERRVLQACVETAARPGLRRTVEVLRHSISSSQHLQLSLDAGAATFPLLDLTVEIKLDLPYLAIEVRAGSITALRAEQAAVTSTLSEAGVILVESERKALRLWPAQRSAAVA